MDFGGGVTIVDEGNTGAFVAKYNSNGVIQWASGPTGAGNDHGTGVVVDDDGNVYFTGGHGSGLDFGGGNTVADEGNIWGIFVAKYNTAGVIQWASGPTGAGQDYGYGIAIDGDVNVYIDGFHESGLDFGGGITVANEGNTGVFVAKYTTTGIVQWASGPTGPSGDYAYDITVDDDGDVYIAGFQYGGVDFGGGHTVADEGDWGAFVTKYSTVGVAQWASGPSGSGTDYGFSVAVDSDGDVYFSGFHQSGLDFGGGITVANEGGNKGVFIAKYD